ncbi:hypothetical protein [Actinomycetospora sp. TBRC 11914]|uniref:hypothetical protein n=1 Tax=Actinomycetospora sp. TBRC 11914 TaxID=2729387 RepID=UPI00145E234F|nr:hypothetical protein [Actinomycetospora sp. TBRC 11914]NMO90947.1 hypothetical protein [Actinomycetospora sp. TBRC 11914]
MTIAQAPPRTLDAAAQRREALLSMVQAATEALVAAAPGAVREDAATAHVLARARATAEENDGTGGRAAAAIRTAWAHLAAGQAEDAFLALSCAGDALAPY